VSASGYNQMVEYSDASMDTMLNVPRQAVLLTGDVAFGSTDRMSITPQATPCVETTWWRNHNGYGKAMRQRRSYLAHRYAWEQTNGPIPAGLNVLHRCDNPPCINLDHLFLGTVHDNNADRDAKGRTPGGERHASSRLTDAEVIEMRTAYRDGARLAALSERYGIGRQSVNDIVNGRRWKQVGGPIATNIAPHFPRSSSPEERDSARRMYAAGMTKAAISRALDRDHVSIINWLREEAA
jgi:hypothetical protein